MLPPSQEKGPLQGESSHASSSDAEAAQLDRCVPDESRLWLLALSWQREGCGRGASLHCKWRLGNAAARAELGLGAERNQTQRSYLLQGCPGFRLLTGRCSSCYLLAFCSLCQQNTQAFHITALLGHPKLLYQWKLEGLQAVDGRGPSWP